MPPRTYDSFVQTAKNFANKGEEYRLRLMHLLIEMEAAKVVWYGHPHTTWTDVLCEERLCTPAAFAAFKKAITYGLKVDQLGVAASCLLAKQTKDIRTIVVRQTTEWVKQHKVPPSYQLVSEYVKHLLRERGKRTIGPYAKLRVECNKLLAENLALTEYVTKLRATLHRNALPIPKR